MDLSLQTQELKETVLPFKLVLGFCYESRKLTNISRIGIGRYFLVQIILVTLVTGVKEHICLWS